MRKKKLVFSQRRYDTGMKLMDLGNWAAGALVFGQGVAGGSFDFKILILGLLVLVSLYLAGWNLMNEKGGGKRK
jgi:hypothetical protein